MDDFRKYFSRVQLCRVNDKYHYSHFQARHKIGSYALIRLVVTGQGGHHYLTINQTDDRCFDRKVDYDYSPVRFMLAKIDDPKGKKKLIYLNGKMGWHRDTWEDYENLEAGEYYMFVEFDWREGSEHTEFVVSCYGESKTYFLRDEKAQYNKDEVIRELMASCAEGGKAPETKVVEMKDAP